MSIPVVLVNFNRLTTTRKLVFQLQTLGYRDIHILDNTSTYPPLLEWYKEIGLLGVMVHHMDRNYLQNVIYDAPIRAEFTKYEWIAYTDSDIELNAKTPKGFIEHLIALADLYKINKVGLALKIDHLPAGNTNKEWESNFWVDRVGEDIYKAPIDTTFAVIRPTLPLQFEALRVAGDYTAIHTPWDLNFDTLDDEELYYLEHAHEYSTFKRQFDLWRGGRPIRVF